MQFGHTCCTNARATYLSRMADPTKPDPIPAPSAETVVTRPVLPQLPPEVGGTEGPEPTRYGDWSHKGRCTDF